MRRCSPGCCFGTCARTDWRLPQDPCRTDVPDRQRVPGEPCQMRADMDCGRNLNESPPNSLAVRLPAAVVEALELREGDEIDIHVADARRLGIARKPGREELLKRLRTFRGRLPAGFKFDRDAANAR